MDLRVLYTMGDGGNWNTDLKNLQIPQPFHIDRTRFFILIITFHTFLTRNEGFSHFIEIENKKMAPDEVKRREFWVFDG